MASSDKVTAVLIRKEGSRRLNFEVMEISVTPPDSLVKFDAPLFVGIEPGSGGAKATMTEGASKIDDMINSMLPPR